MNRIISTIKKTARRTLSIRELLQQRKNLTISRQKLATLADGDYFVKPMPTGHIAQWASPELTSHILDGKNIAADDPKWRDFGFKTRKDYEFWSWRICGLMCVKNVLDEFDLAYGKSVADLTFEAENLGGYDVKNDKGWYYRPLIKLAENYGLSGRIHGRLSVEEIAAAVLKNEFIVASVHPEVIRGDLDENPHGSSGHLVLMIGFRLRAGKITGVYFNNPSGRTVETQKKAFLSADQFSEAFAGRGFSLRKSNF